MLLRVGLVACFVAMITGATTAPADTTPNRDLFESEKTALSFAASLGPEWREVAGKQYCCEIEGLRVTRYTFKWTQSSGLVHIGVDAKGRPRFYEVRYPIVGKVCSGVPNTRELARMLLENTEPVFANDVRNINRLGSSADLVWPWTAFRSGPGNQFGKTQFFFFKMNGYCTVRVKRRLA
jgi:hypothetical protein